MARRIVVQHENSRNRKENWLVALGLEEAILELQNIAQKKYFSKGSTLFVAGELPAGLFLLRSGRVKLSLPLDRQSSLPSQVIRPGELLGLSETVAGKPHELTARAELPSEAVLFPRTPFLEIICQNPAFGLSISSFISKQVEDAYERIRMIRSHNPGYNPRKIQKGPRAPGQNHK